MSSWLEERKKRRRVASAWDEPDKPLGYDAGLAKSPIMAAVTGVNLHQYSTVRSMTVNEPLRHVYKP